MPIAAWKTFGVLAVVLACGGLSRGQAPTAPASRPASSSADAQDLRGGLLNDRPLLIVAPRGREPNSAPTVRFPPSGTQLVDRRARLDWLAKANWYVLRTEPGPNEPAAVPWPVLPNRLLEELEPLLAKQPDVPLRVSGETTIYRGCGYVFLREALVESQEQSLRELGALLTGRQADSNWGAAAGPPPGDQATRPIDLAAEAGPQTPTTQSAAAEPASQPADQALSPDDILRQLSRERPGKAVRVPIISAVATASQPSVAPGGGQPLSPGRGTMVVDRIVRILPERQDGWWAANFEGDNTLREPPIRLLPCPLLEEAETRAVASPARPLKFRVSGEVTLYKGQRYLLLRKLLVEYDLDQL